MTYLSAVLADTPVHYWRMADSGGAYLHDLGSTPRALQIGGPGQGVVLPYSGPNSDGGAAWIGLNNGLNYTDLDLPFTQPCSLECWFWLHHLNAAIVGFLSVSDSVTAIEIGLDATMHAHAFTNGGTLVAAAPTTRQHWHHLVLTCSVAATALYLDGVNVAAGVGAAIGAWSPGFVVGAGGNPVAPTRFANTAIAEVAVYTGLLAAGRVTAHFVAADQVATRPVYRGHGGFYVTSGAANTK